MKKKLFIKWEERIVVMVLTLLFMSCFFSANAATINGITLPYPTDYTSSYGTISGGVVKSDYLGSGCWRFAYLVYGEVFKRNMAEDKDNASCVVTPYHQVLPTTADNLKTYIRKSGPGAVIRVTSYTYYNPYDNNGHSMVIINSDENGAWIYQAGGDGTILSGNTIKYWTWSVMAQKCVDGGFSKHGQYIKYILCPEGYRTFGGGSTPQTPVSDSWTYRVVTSDGLNMRSYASTSGGLVTTLFSPTTIAVTKKTTANGYTWGYGTSSTGYTGWIVVDNSWTTLVSSTVDSTAPTISNVRVYDVSSSGYTISCSVSDNVGVTKVAFPTWTTNNGQDDLFSDWGNTALGTISNGTATYRVNTSQHNNETGCTYITHIYAYDAAGNTGHVNQSNYSDLQVQVPTPTISTTGIQLDRSSVDVNLGSSGDKSFSLVATIYPANATNKTVHWSSSNQNIARVDDNGLVTPTTVGSAVITAMAENGGYQATCTVNVSTWINGISLNTTEATLDLADHETLQLTKAITPNTATNKSVVWNSTDTSVATVSSNGLVTPVGTGVAIITCTAQDPGGYFALCAITVVNNIDVESIALSQTRIVFDHPGDIGRMLSASFAPSNATNTNLTWLSSDETIAKVTDGIILPQHEGYTRITCTAESDATAVCDVIVHADEIMNLPSSLKTIKARAFYGSSIREVVIPGRTTTIGAKAFANCDDLRLVIIPNSVTSIASDAFSGSENVVFICESNSTAAKYAATKQITAVLASMPESVTIYADTTTIVKGQSLWLGAEVIPSGISQRVTWSIIDGKSIASIDQTGMLTTSGTGQVSVAATALNGAAGIINITVLEKPTTYRVVFDANGGTCDSDGRDAVYDTAIGTLPIPSREFFSFDGWYLERAGGSRYTEDTVYSNYDADTLTLYAHWTRLTCTITYNANGGTCATASKEMNRGDAIGNMPTPTRAYYTFKGWYTAASGGTMAEETTIFTTNTTVYAQWTQNGFGSWSAWSTISVSGNDNRQVETKTEQVQTGTKTTYNYNRFLYYHPGYGYNMASYGSNWATSQGYSGSWQYLSSSTRLAVDHQTDGQNVYLGEVRDGNKWWYNESVSTEPIYSTVTYYRYRDRQQ